MKTEEELIWENYNKTVDNTGILLETTDMNTKIYLVVKLHNDRLVDISEVKSTKESADHFAGLLNSKNFKDQGITWVVDERHVRK